MTDPRPRCAKCDQIVDARGIEGRGHLYCRCDCVWPLGGCRAPIYFVVNANERVQPFNYDGTPHHATCAAFRRWKDQARKEQRPPGVVRLDTFFK